MLNYRPLMKEVLWYTVVAPQLTRLSPHLGELLPDCFHGHSNYEEDFRPTWCERFCCVLCWLPARKLETGLLMLENLMER